MSDDVVDYETETFSIDGVSIDVDDLQENFESVELKGATPNDDLREFIADLRHNSERRSYASVDTDTLDSVA